MMYILMYILYAQCGPGLHYSVDLLIQTYNVTGSVDVWKACYKISVNIRMLFSPLAKLTGRAVYFADVFSLFFKFFNGRLSSPRSSNANRAIFTKISGLVDGCKGMLTSLRFFDFSRDVMATKVEKSTFFPDQSTLSICHSETERDNALYMQNIIAALMPL